MYNMGHYGSLWVTMGHYGSLWVTMGHYGSLCQETSSNMASQTMLAAVLARFKCFCFGLLVSQAALNVNATNLDQMEKEMIAEIQKMFSVWRAQRDLEIGIASEIQVEDVEQRGDNAILKQNGEEQFGMTQPEQHSATTQQKL